MSKNAKNSVPSDFECTIAFLGEGAVGKSAVTLRYLGQEFTTVYDPTIEDFYTTNKSVNGRTVRVSILDTAGQEELSSILKESWIRTADGFILVFDLTNPRSFQTIQQNYDDIVDRKTRQRKQQRGAEGKEKENEQLEVPPIILIGNKQDLTESRKIGTEEAQSLAKRLNITYFETSALSGTPSIDESFTHIITLLLDRRFGARGRRKSRGNGGGICTML